MNATRWLITPLLAAGLALMAGCSAPQVADESGAAAPGAPPPASPPAAPAGTAGVSEPDEGAREKAKFIPTVRGVANVGYLAPVTKVEGGMVVTTFRVKNTSAQAIAGLKVEEFWRDKAGNLVGGTTDQLRQPLLPGEMATLTVRTPKDPRMYQNQYRFLHAYGAVKVDLLAELK